MFELGLVVALGLAGSFLCSIMESVLLSTSHSFVAVLQDRGDRAGRLLAGMQQDIDEPIAAILTLNTIAHTVGAAVGGALALEVFGNEWVAVFSAALTLAILMFSEILPKTLGAMFWQRLARPIAYTLRALVVVMKPILVPLAVFNRLITPRRKREATVSRAELEVLAAIGRREGTIREEEWRVVSNAMNLNRVKVRDVMTPRTRMVGVPADSTLAEVKSVMLETGYFRLPAYEESVDDVVGILVARDVWRAEERERTSIGGILHEPHFVPETKPVEELIREMRRKQIKMAIVVDEFGGTAGLVTLEDLIEEIVGEIRDEHESEMPPFEEGAHGAVLIAGSVPVWEVNERLGLHLPEHAYDTIAGYLFGELQRLARPGDEVSVPTGRLRVTAVDGRRIERVAYIPSEANELVESGE